MLVYDAIDPDGTEREADAEAVRKAVLTLPVRYREAILLFYFEDKSVGDAASVLGIAEGTLKARLHRIPVVSVCDGTHRLPRRGCVRHYPSANGRAGAGRAFSSVGFLDTP